MDGTKSRAFRSRLTTMLRALPCTRARVTRDSYESPSSPAPRRTASRDRVILLVVVLCLRCGFKVHSERDLLPPAGYKITIFIMRQSCRRSPHPGRGRASPEAERPSHARRGRRAGERRRARPHSDSSRAARTGAPRAASRRSSPPHDRLGHPPRASTRPRGTARRGGGKAAAPTEHPSYPRGPSRSVRRWRLGGPRF